MMSKARPSITMRGVEILRGFASAIFYPVLALAKHRSFSHAMFPMDRCTMVRMKVVCANDMRRAFEAQCEYPTARSLLLNADYLHLKACNNLTRFIDTSSALIRLTSRNGVRMKP